MNRILSQEHKGTTLNHLHRPWGLKLPTHKISIFQCSTIRCFNNSWVICTFSNSLKFLIDWTQWWFSWIGCGCESMSGGVQSPHMTVEGGVVWYRGSDTGLTMGRGHTWSDNAFSASLLIRIWSTFYCRWWISSYRATDATCACDSASHKNYSNVFIFIHHEGSTFVIITITNVLPLWVLWVLLFIMVLPAQGVVRSVLHALFCCRTNATAPCQDFWLNCSQPELINFGIQFSPIACDITISLGPVLYWLIMLYWVITVLSVFFSVSFCVIAPFMLSYSVYF